MSDDLRKEAASVIIGLLNPMRVGGGPHLRFERVLEKRANDMLKQLANG